MSLIPKIKVGRPTRRSTDNLSFDCSTTSNFGDLQPTMCREMVPNQSMHVKTSSLVRLASMPLPTFGRLTLRHYHAFVPYDSLYEPFDAFLSAQHYKASTEGSSFIPTQIPRFNLHYLWSRIIEENSYIGVIWKDRSAPCGIGEEVMNDKASLTTLLQRIQTDISHYHFNESVTANDLNIGNNGTSFGYFVFGDVYYDGRLMQGTGEPEDIDPQLFLENSPDDAANVVIPRTVTPEGADYMIDYGEYILCFKLTPQARHLRKIIVGLGYQFSPFNGLGNTAIYENVLKILAFYKTWFEYFRPHREIGWMDTACYEFIKRSQGIAPRDFTFGAADGAGYLLSNLYGVIEALMKETYYYLPSDYFSMSIQSPSMGSTDLNTVISSPVGRVNGSSNPFIASAQTNAYVGSSILAVGTSAPASPIAQRLAQRLLTFTNKNTVVGRSIRDYLKAHFGVEDTNTQDDSAVYRIGVSNVQINISDVMSTAPSADGFLGEYAGKGIGYNESEHFDYTAKKFGVWLTLSCVIPQSGYYQGSMRENSHKERFDFFTPEFDALGYQVLERKELMDAYVGKSSFFNPNTNYSPLQAFGFVPRYSEYKVGRNIVNGDLSLHGMPAMRAYFFDRRFPDAHVRRLIVSSASETSPWRYQTALVRPSNIPSVVYDGFRKVGIDDRYGYLRIFNVTSPLVDHFIIHTMFDVRVEAPWKSLRDSFDTIEENDDVMEISHS